MDDFDRTPLQSALKFRDPYLALSGQPNEILDALRACLRPSIEGGQNSRRRRHIVTLPLVFVPGEFARGGLRRPVERDVAAEQAGGARSVEEHTGRLARVRRERERVGVRVKVEVMIQKLWI